MTNNDFIIRLERLMAENGVKGRRALERLTGIEYHRLNAWWRQDRRGKPNAGDLTILATKLGVTPSYLLAGEENDEIDSKRIILTERLNDCDADELHELEDYLDFLELKRSDRTRK